MRELHNMAVLHDAEAEVVLALENVVRRRVARRRDAECLRLEPLRQVTVLHLLTVHEHERKVRDLLLRREVAAESDLTAIGAVEADV